MNRRRGRPRTGGRVATALVVAAVAGAAALLAPAPIPAAADDATGVAVAAAIDARVRAEMEASGIPGVAVAVVEDGRTVHAAAFGVAGPDGRAMTTRTPVVIGSVGKSITALAVRQLVEGGRVQLDAPLRRYLPWFSLAAAPGVVEAVTVRSLLEHTSGLSTADGQDPAWYASGLGPEQIARALAAVRPDRTAGTYEYSNLNYVLLGVLVEAVSGEPYGAYVAAHIFGPLGMGDSSATGTAPGADDPARAPAVGHRYLFGLPVAWDEPIPSGIVPAGYQVSTADDMARFVAALAAGGVAGGVDILSGRPAQPGAATSSGAGALGTDWQALAAAEAGVSVGQSGATLTSNADILVMPGRRLGVVVLLNANPTQLLGLPRGAAELALDVLRLQVGLSSAPAAPTVRTVYLAVDALLAILFILLFVHAWRARTWPARLVRTRHRRLFLARTVVADLVLPLAVIVGLPLAIGATGSTRPGDLVGGWRFVLWTLPDLGVALLALAGVPLALGAWKLVRARRPAARGTTLPAVEAGAGAA